MGSTRSNIKFDVAPGVVKQPSCELRMAYDHDVRSAAMKLVRMKGFFVAAFLKEVRDDQEHTEVDVVRKCVCLLKSTKKK